MTPLAPLVTAFFRHHLAVEKGVSKHTIASYSYAFKFLHVLRHTCAMNSLQATRDIRKVALWLGHTSLKSTEIYLRTLCRPGPEKAASFRYLLRYLPAGRDVSI